MARLNALSDNEILEKIRPELPEDAPAVFEVNTEAFGRPDEARLVETMRSDPAALLSLVAETDTGIIGHVFFTSVTLQKNNGDPIRAAALGPVGVLPDVQQQGIGSALIQAGLDLLRESSLPFCVVLGHSSYYPRFGFQPSTRFGIRSQWDVPEEVFMVLELRPGGLEDCAGTIYYSDPFLDV